VAAGRVGAAIAAADTTGVAAGRVGAAIAAAVGSQTARIFDRRQ
jgi:hypothetical protein